MCNKPVDTAHLFSCRFVINGACWFHDVMRDQFWLPLCKSVIGAGVYAEVDGLPDDEGFADKRPGDIVWPPGFKWRGIDIGYTDPKKTDQWGIRKASRTLPAPARKTGCAAKSMENIKITNLKKFPIDSKPADSVILPAVFELTGGAGPCANKVFAFLAEVEYPGNPKDDPRVARLRNLWISHQRKLHSAQMVRIRANLMQSKRNKIRQRRAYAVCAPKRACAVGLDGMHLQDDLVCGAALPKNAFDGVQRCCEDGVPDSVVV